VKSTAASDTQPSKQQQRKQKRSTARQASTSAASRPTRESKHMNTDNDGMPSLD